jgi:hypothetical protein
MNYTRQPPAPVDVNSDREIAFDKALVLTQLRHLCVNETGIVKIQAIRTLMEYYGLFKKQ